MVRRARPAWATWRDASSSQLFFFLSQFPISHLCNLNGASIHRFGPWACWNELKDSVLMSGVKSLASSSLPGGQTPTGRFL